MFYVGGDNNLDASHEIVNDYWNWNNLLLLTCMMNINVCRSRIKMAKQFKNPKYHTVRIVLKFNRKIVEIGIIDTPNTQISDRPLVGLVQALFDGVKLVLWDQRQSTKILYSFQSC